MKKKQARDSNFGFAAFFYVLAYIVIARA